jgi:DNA-binding winged helix-turn-helix (wHTH) protein/tetratricopeptide (TPR) repeat protein
MSLVAQRNYRFDDFELRVSSRALFRRGQEVSVGSKAFEVLVCLVESAGKVVTKDELISTVWPDSFVDESNLAHHIFALRKALGDRSAFIKTIPGRGYQFTAIVQEVVERPERIDEIPLAVAGGVTFQRTREHAHLVIEKVAITAPAMPKILRWQIFLPIACMVLALAAFAAWKQLQKRASRGYQRIVVAELTNSTGDPAFDRSLNRALEIDLGQSPFFGVMSESEAGAVLKLMGRKGGTPLIGDVAQEVCERDNRDVLISDAIAQVGSVYLLTLQATDCHSGKTLASAKAQADSKEHVLSAIDSTADHIRSQLGESAQSRESYGLPIAQVSTPSLEALKAYSIGRSMLEQGQDPTEILPYFLRAIELDPQFAMAYAAIGTNYYNTGSAILASQYFRKAFELRRNVGPRESLSIEAHYYSDGLGDIEQGIKAYKAWVAIYPYEVTAWLNIANGYTELGQYAPAVEAAEHAFKLAPENAVTYNVLMRADRKQNRLADAKSIGHLAVERGKGSVWIHAMLYEIAWWEQDQAAIAREVSWSEANSGYFYFPYDRGKSEFFSGRYQEAIRLIESSHEIAQHAGLSESADAVFCDRATWALDYGLKAEAREALQRVKADPTAADVALARIRLGDLAYGQKFLEQQEASEPQGTLVRFVLLPRVRAALLMARHKPLEAVAALEPARPYELSSFYVLIERGEAYLEANQPKLAAVEFRKALDHYGIDVIAPEIPIAHLGLGRAYAMDGNSAASRGEYRWLFAIWKNADADLPVLAQARVEYARLEK